jgi:NADH-quinone oxidoreductase subunit K
MIPEVTLNQVLILAAMLFSIGLVGVLVRRNTLFVLISLEVMLNATGLAFIAAGSFWNQPEGQIMFLAVVTLGAAEVAVGLGLVLVLFRHYKSVDIDLVNELRG